MKLAEVHTLYETNASNVPAMLRQAADSIESEVAEGFDPTRAVVAVQISETGTVQVYGWGQTDTMHAISVLQLGLVKMTNEALGTD